MNKKTNEQSISHDSTNLVIESLQQNGARQKRENPDAVFNQFYIFRLG